MDGIPDPVTNHMHRAETNHMHELLGEWGGLTLPYRQAGCGYFILI